MPNQLVNLITNNPKIEDLILTEYPGRIFERQCLKVGNRNSRTYLFINLDEETLHKFLRSERINPLEYEIIPSHKVISDSNIRDN